MDHPLDGDRAPRGDGAHWHAGVGVDDGNEPAFNEDRRAVVEEEGCHDVLAGRPDQRFGEHQHFSIGVPGSFSDGPPELAVFDAVRSRGHQVVERGRRIRPRGLDTAVEISPLVETVELPDPQSHAYAGHHDHADRRREPTASERPPGRRGEGHRRSVPTVSASDTVAPMGVLSWVVVGLVAGALAGVATGKRVKGCLPTILIGVLGALLGGAVFSAAGQDGINDFGLWSIFVAFIGASVLLLVFGGRFDERRRR